jgi:type IV secretory pathway VirB4 component
MARGKASQDFVPVEEVRDGIVKLKDGSLCAVVLASSVNLALKSEQEQTAIILQFQSFLNTLEFSTQIVVQSRRLDIRPYLALLEARLGEQEEELLRTQTREYIGFIQWFSESVNIMSKNFFIVIPYGRAPLAPTRGGGPLSGITSLFNRNKKQNEPEVEAFEEQRSQLEQRIAIVRQGLSAVGVRVVTLGTQEVIEMYYNIFNPGETQRGVPDQN